MRRTYIGEFEELILLVVAILGEKSYGISVMDEIKGQTGRKINISAVHSALKRLERKGYLSSLMGGAEAKRGGRRKRFYRLTIRGKTALAEIRKTRESLWIQIPDLTFS